MIIFVFAVTNQEVIKKGITSSISWLPTADTWLKIGVQVDALTTITLFFVSWTILMIFIYSVGYHNFGQPEGDHDRPGLPPHGAEIIDQEGKHQHVPSIEPMYARFFGFFGLFAFAMYLLVVSNNLLTLYIGWEVMGLCSYLLIGFWYAKPSAKAAAQKAFLTTRIGDVFMLIGLAALYTITGSLQYEVIFSEEVIHNLATTISPVLGLSWAGLIGLLIFMGVVGKSSQFPLHVWLPDAMEGPTPVSAMIHAATMVSAGVYLAIRFFPVLSAGWDGGAVLTTPYAGDGRYRFIYRSILCNNCCCPTRCQKSAGVFHHLSIGIHDCRFRRWCLCCRCFSPCNPCYLQSLVIPRIWVDHPRYGAWSITYPGTH